MAAPKDASSVISDAHVREVLRMIKGEDAEMLSWHTRDFTEKGDNYGSCITRLNINYSLIGHQHTTSSIVKIEPKRGSYADNPEIAATIFMKETRYYRELEPALSSELTACGMSRLRVPKFYTSDLNSPQKLVFIEDLIHRGFRMHDRTKGMDVAHTLLVVRELARLHAASLLLQEKTPQHLADQYPFLNPDWTTFAPNSKDVVRLTFNGSLTLSLEIIKMVGGHKKAEEWLANALENTTDVIEELLQRKSPFEVVCHGDCWNSNILFRYNSARVPKEVMLLDHQVCRVASPATDLAYFFFTSLNGNTRINNLQYFLSVYHNTFSSVLKAGGISVPFTLQELTQEYKEKEEFGTLFATLSIFVAMNDKSEMPDTENLKAEDIPKLIEELRQRSLDKIKNDLLFRSRFLGLYDSMKDD